MTKAKSRHEKTLLHQVHQLYRSEGGRADLATLAGRLQRLEIGISAEEEFAVLLRWLGRCRLVHKLDQTHASARSYKVPDLLAIFEYKRRTLPVLIEVKATIADKLSWTPAYLGGLQRYARHCGLPVLLAWKHAVSGFWVLCELRHFQKAVTNYKLRFLDALMESLMGPLAGDFSFKLQSGLTMNMRMKKLRDIERDGEGRFTRGAVRIERAYFATRDGTEVNAKGLMWFFLSIDQDSDLREEGEYLHQTFTIPDEPPAQFAHRVLPLLLGLRKGRANVEWHEWRLRRGLPAGGSGLRKAARPALEARALRYVFDIFPKSGLPDFLRQASQTRRANRTLDDRSSS